MSFSFFNRVLHQLNRKLKYDAAVGYAGNSFYKDSGKLIEQSNPLLREKKKGDGSAYGEQMAAMLNMHNIQIVRRTKEEMEHDGYGIVFGKNDGNSGTKD